MKFHEHQIGWKPLMLLILTMAGFHLLSAGPIRAAGPPTDPILRVETGMHTAQIFRIGVDREEKFLVTGSVDKTVRVWDYATGEIRKILRTPMDQADDGTLYAAVVSLDGRTVAAGGWTGYASQGGHSID